ncbi:ankyrin repeat-containing domain protein [Nemania sp. NC0429]|nr:ankyrin repeat-containing domain protein [Nemania sp. NC0429]
MVDDMGFSALHRVILSSKAEGSLISANAFVQAGADINAIVTRDGLSCLHIAADRNRVEISRRLIDVEANVHIVNAFTQETPLLRAGHYNSVGMVRYPYDARASLESPNRDGETSVRAAASGDAEAALVLLLHFGADTDQSISRSRPCCITASSANKLSLK